MHFLKPYNSNKIYLTFNVLILNESIRLFLQYECKYSRKIHDLYTPGQKDTKMPSVCGINNSKNVNLRKTKFKLKDFFKKSQQGFGANWSTEVPVHLRRF